LSKSAGFKVGIFLIISISAIVVSVVFLLVQKDFFTDHSFYTLSSPSGEGITEGMPLLFSGFEIGKVASLELDEAGNVIISVKVPARHSTRINQSSTFTLEKPFIGSPRFVVKTPDIKALQADEDVIFPTETIDDINEVIKKLQPMVEKVDEIATNVKIMTDKDSDLTKTLANAQTITDELARKQGVIEMLAGDKKTATDFKESISSLNTALKEAETLISNANKTLLKADEQILGEEGSVTKVNRIIDDIEKKMKDLDSLVSNLVKTGENVEGATTDLEMLRKEVDMTLNSVNIMIKDVRNALPIEQRKEIKLP
jgi:phospholipid/cholesterol/gamma-HCH transport system substrate-binding protein